MHIKLHSEPLTSVFSLNLSLSCNCDLILNISLKLELYRAHTPHASCCALLLFWHCRNICTYHFCVWAESTWSAVGVINRHDQNTNTKTNNFVAIMASIFNSKWNQPIFFAVFDSLVALTAQSGAPDLEIFVPTTTTVLQTDHFTPCACAWDKYADAQINSKQ